MKKVGELRQTSLAVNAATGSGFTITGRIVVLWQPLPEVTVSITLKTPADVNI